MRNRTMSPIAAFRRSLAMILVLVIAAPAGAQADEARGLPSLPDTLRPDAWWTLGPVPIGSREAGREPLAAMRPAGPWPPDRSRKLASWLIPGGWAAWSPLP
ncbi:MAG: hypothetical protein GF355_03695, partial [Candidatus Eisenbacteria bacterium]|nr:hypothetical protein [Candidatus Eisenbacteria bacterium]